MSGINLTLRDLIVSYVRWFVSSLLNSKFSDASRPLVIVTGSDSSHFRSQLQFLTSATQREPNALFVVWDLGWSEEEAGTIQTNFPNAIYRRFPYGDYPSYFNVTKARGEYAWKPVAILKTAEEFGPKGEDFILLWCDAGNVFFRRLRWLRRYIGKNSVFSPFSPGTIKDWTHPGTLEHFQLAPEELSRSNCSGALVGFDLATEEAWSVLRQWAKLAAVKSVFAPDGSSRANHRQDQAVLGCILVKEKLLSDSSFRTNWTEEYLTNQDIDHSGDSFRAKPRGLLRRLVARVLRVGGGGVKSLFHR